MRETLSYNIHGILSFQINRKKRRDLVRDVDLPYSYFETEHIGEPDIILNLGDFEPQNSGCYVVDRKWHIKSGYIYCSERVSGVRFNIEIIGIEASPTVINVSTNVRKIRQLFLPSVLPQKIVLGLIIDFKMLCKGSISIHAAAAASGGAAIVLLGRGGAFKTTLLMDFVRNMGYSFLGDERVIVNKDNVFSFPIHNQVFDYRLNRMKTEDYTLFTRFGYLLCQRSTRRAPEYIVDKANISSVYPIVKTNGDELKVERLSRSDLVSKTVNSYRMENMRGPAITALSKGLYDYFVAYSYVFPDSRIANYWDIYGSILAECLNADEYYEIFLPRTYTEDTFRDFVDLTRNLEK